MTSRERIKRILNHKEADRVPIDFGAMRSTGIASIAYNNLLKHLHISEECKMYDFQQQLAYPGEAIRKRFHVDALDVGQAFLEKESDWKSWVLNDGSKCLIPSYLNIEKKEDGSVLLKGQDDRYLGIQPPSSLYTDQIYWPWRSVESIPEEFDKDELNNHMWAVPCSPFHLDWVNNTEEFNNFIRIIKHLHENEDYAIMISIGHNLFEQGTFMRGLDNFLMDIYLDPKGVERFIDILVEGYMPKLKRILDGVKDYVDIIQFGDDLGTSDSTWMSKDIFNKIFKPRYRKMWQYVHDNSDCKVFLHSCGSIYDFLPSLIDAGVDIINPVQTTAKKMEPERLKKEFGKDITFWGGGCNTRDILPTGTVQDVKDDVKRRIDILAPGGGFVFNQIHNILADVPPENIVAMFDAAYEFGKY